MTTESPHIAPMLVDGANVSVLEGGGGIVLVTFRAPVVAPDNTLERPVVFRAAMSPDSLSQFIQTAGKVLSAIKPPASRARN